MNKDKIYVVFVGRNTGIYDTWEECKKQVQGFKGAIFKSYVDLDPKRKGMEELSKFQRGGHIMGSCDIRNKKPQNGICSDAGYSSKTNILQYRVVDIESGMTVFYNKFDNFKSRHLMNVGEFFGLVRAVDYVLTNRLDLIIYCDSTTAINWVKNRAVNTSIEDKEIGKMLMKGIMYLNRVDKMPTIVKWQTDLWGEIPADFGNKKSKKK